MDVRVRVSKLPFSLHQKQLLILLIMIMPVFDFRSCSLMCCFFFWIDRLFFNLEERNPH